MTSDNVTLGREYELYVGSLYESQGKEVVYNGIINGIDDGKVDLIVISDKSLRAIQCKRWSQSKLIDADVVLGFAEAITRLRNNSHPMAHHAFELKDFDIKGILVTTTALDNKAKSVARQLGVEVVENKRKDPQFVATDAMAQEAAVRSQQVIDRIKLNRPQHDEKIAQNGRPRLRGIRIFVLVVLAIIASAAVWFFSFQPVWIAPFSGTKYHKNRFCDGLKEANAVEMKRLTDVENIFAPCRNCVK